MKKIIQCFCYFIIISCYAQSPSIEWEYKLTGANNYIYSISLTSDGGFIASGTTRPIPFPNFNVDLKIIKFNAAGTIEWQKDYDLLTDYSGKKIIQTADGGYGVIGRTSIWDGPWLAKLDAQGNILWDIAPDGGSPGDCAQIFDVTSTTDGGFVVTGMFCTDVLAIKVSATGQIVWQIEYPPAEYFWRPKKIIELADGSLVIYGEPYTDAGNLDVHIWKFDSNGNFLNSAVFGGLQSDQSSDFKQTSDGGFILTGVTRSNLFYGAQGRGGADIFLMKLGNNFELEWCKTYGGSGGDYSTAISNTNDGGYVITGYTSSQDGDVFGNYPYDFQSWTFKTDAVGNLQWQKIIGVNGSFMYDVVQAPDSGYFIAGCNKNNLQNELYVAKLSANLAINEFDENSIIISPNPVSQTLSIATNNFVVTDKIIVYDLTGRMVKDISGNIRQIDVNDLSKGTYLLKVFTEEKVYQAKFIKE